MKKCICVVSIGRENILDISYPTIKKYSNRIGVDLILITEKKYDIKSNNDSYNYLTFEKNQIYELFDSYDRILRVDSDVIIKDECPDLFENPSGSFYAVFEDVGNRKQHRRSIINSSRKNLGDVVGWDKGYFNSGVILCDKEHKEVFNIDPLKIPNLPLGQYKEQTYLNWLVRVNNIPVIDLGYKYNHMKFFTFELNHNPDESYILHYAGNQTIKLKRMKIDFKKYHG